MMHTTRLRSGAVHIRLLHMPMYFQSGSQHTVLSSSLARLHIHPSRPATLHMKWNMAPAEPMWNMWNTYSPCRVATLVRVSARRPRGAWRADAPVRPARAPGQAGGRPARQRGAGRGARAC
eukprot:2932780-Prymnesium_polylepis.1